jgi:hypothetical protein
MSSSVIAPLASGRDVKAKDFHFHHIEMVPVQPLMVAGDLGQ